MLGNLPPLIKSFLIITVKNISMTFHLHRTSQFAKYFHAHDFTCPYSSVSQAGTVTTPTVNEMEIMIHRHG